MNIKDFKSIKTRQLAKIAIGCGVLFLILLLLDVVIHVYMRHHVQSNLHNSAIQFGQNVKTSLDHYMLTNEPHNLQDLVMKMADNEGIEALWIYDKVGTVHSSSHSDEIGLHREMSDASCQICHNTSPAIRSTTISFVNEHGQHVYRNVNPIENSPDCHPCHDPNEILCGVIISDFSIPKIENSFISQAGFLLISGTGCFLFLVVGLILMRSPQIQRNPFSRYSLIILPRKIAHFLKISDKPLPAEGRHETSTGHSRAVSLAKKFIDSRYTQPISVCDITQAANLGYRQLGRKFKSETGCTLITYLNKMRIEKARELLLNTDLSIKEISSQVGYENQSSFASMFRKRMGCSAQQFRNQQLTDTFS